MKQQEERGKINKLTGRVKEAAGIITGNTRLEQEGFRQRAKGAIQEQVGKARRKVDELIGKSTKD
jgi:uncharacterized protein YjbJ (UPF0337 family)